MNTSIKNRENGTAVKNGTKQTMERMEVAFLAAQILKQKQLANSTPCWMR